MKLKLMPSARAVTALCRRSPVFLSGLIAVCLGSHPAIAGAGGAPLMALPGAADVTSSGAFTYNVPIDTPPGTAGMEPALALQYSSQAGDGYQGLGWSLKGLPTIVRCAETLAQGNRHGGIGYNQDDRFCLDGQRLVAIAGTYGANGTEYRTEIDKFARVISYGSVGGGPGYFKVWTKTGQVIELGNTTDSQALAQGKTTVNVWATNRISDTTKNYLTVTYNAADSAERTQNGEIYPVQLDYAGNNKSGLAETLPYNHVNLAYSDRNAAYAYPLYHAGARFMLSKVLTNVKAYSGASLISDYRLAYQAPANGVQRYELTSITRCDGTVPAKCLPPTKFTWQGSRDTPAVTTRPSLLPLSIDLGVVGIPGDYNGDGLTDVYIANRAGQGSCNWFAGSNGSQIGTGSGHYLYDTSTSQFICLQSGSRYGQNIRGISDTNNDGLTDLFTSSFGLLQRSIIYTSKGVNAGNSLWQNYSPTYFPGTTSLFTGDLNGDGLTDFYDVTHSTLQISDGDGTFTADTSRPGLHGDGLDYDANGCTDGLTSGDVISFSCNSVPPQVTLPTWGAASTATGDFNGDGLPDYLVVYPYNPNAQKDTELYLNKGDNFERNVIPNFTGEAYATFVSADFNGDGRTDILKLPQGTLFVDVDSIWLSTGKDFQLLIDNLGTPPNQTALVADLNYDGAQDVIIDKFWHDQETVTEVDTAFIPELISAIDTGVGATVSGTPMNFKVTYDRANQGAPFYTKGMAATYPNVDLAGPFYLVKNINNYNGLGGLYTTQYSYAQGITDLRGRGFLGFKHVMRQDPQTGVVSDTEYRQDFPFIGAIASQTVTAPKTGGGTVTLSSVVNIYVSKLLGTSTEGVKRYFVGLDQKVVTGTDLEGSAFATVTDAYDYDCEAFTACYGNLTQMTQSTPDGGSKTTVNTYGAEDPVNWFLGRITRTAVTAVVPGATAVTRTVDFQYSSTTGIKTRETLEPDSPNSAHLRLRKDFTLDRFGNRTQINVQGPGITTRTTLTDYEGNGRFPISTTNALNQVTSVVYDPKFGGLASQTDPNNLTQTQEYDTFGRLKRQLNADGTSVAYSYDYCSGVNGGSAVCPAGGAMAVTTTPYEADGVTQFGAITKGYYDKLGRVLARDSQGFSGAFIRSSITYNDKLRIQTTSRPYFVSGGTPQWTTNTYDAVGRLTQENRPDGSIWKWGYKGLTTTVTDGNNHKTTTIRNQQGRPATITNAANRSTTYRYDGFGNLLTATDPASNVTSATYDVRGRTITGTDPDRGAWTYDYDVLDELTSQTDAKGQSTTFTYDLLGRMIARVEPDLSSSWTYDTAANGVGKLANTTTTAGYLRSYTYDALSRPYRVSFEIEGQTYNYNYRYLSDRGALNYIDFPGTLSAQYKYNQYGFVSSIVDRPTDSPFWTANSRDAELHLTQQTAGNGVVTNQTFKTTTGRIDTIRAGVGGGAFLANLAYEFDPVGNLTERIDSKVSLMEDFTYTSLDELETYTVPGATKSMTYSIIGNIKTKSDVGTYSYGQGAAGPHAVTSITGSLPGTYGYDANGNMTSGPQGAIAYTSFNMTASLPVTGGSITLTYDPEHERIIQNVPSTAAPSSGKTIYVNDPYFGMQTERAFPTSGPAESRNYLVADGRLVMELTDDGTTVTKRYLTTDHLGSVVVVADNAGGLVQRLSYDAWGKRRNPNGTDPTSPITSPTTRGYTGQEMIDQLGLVNLNARIYDPVIGRFMTADSIVPDPWNTLSYNRYSYVNNRPLSLTDPTGYAPLIIGGGSSGSPTIPGWTSPPGTVDELVVTGHRPMNPFAWNGPLPIIPNVYLAYGGQVAGGGQVISPQGGGTGFVGMDGAGLFSTSSDDPWNLDDPLAFGFGGDKFSTEALSVINPELVASEALPPTDVAQGRGSNWDVYLNRLRALGIDGSKIEVRPSVRFQIMRIMATPEFQREATNIFSSDVSIGRETRGIHVYQTKNGAIRIIPYQGILSNSGCSNGASSCMTVPSPDLSIGTLLFTWHPHPVASRGANLPSVPDLIQSRTLHVPGAFWYDNGRGYPIPKIYQTHCFYGAC